MTPDEKIAALLTQTQGLTPGHDSARLSALYAEAASFVDRKAKPKKWAALRFKYGEAVEPTDPKAALDAYREAVVYFDPVQDEPMWASIKACIGYGLVLQGKVTPPESEEVIASFEAAVDALPYVASTLALYYETRTIGDPLENWQKRVKYLNVALEQITAASDPVPWARLKKSLGNALAAEPDGDFAKNTEARIVYLKEALAALERFKGEAGSPAQSEWIKSCIDACEAFTARVGTDRAEALKIAEQFARDGYNACGPLVGNDTRVLATMGLARPLLNKEAGGTRERYREGLRLCHEAELLIPRKAQPVFAGTCLKLQELAHLQLLELGEPDQLEELLKAGDAAYALVANEPGCADLQRTIMQIAAEGLVRSDEFTRAVDYLQRAVEAGETGLQLATTRAGRLEKIFGLHDSYALLGYCLFKAGDLPKGIEAIDKGKGRWWNPLKKFATFERIKLLIPPGGALLFPTFAPKEGAVGVVTESGMRVCELRNLRHDRLKELLLGDILNPQGESWIGRYVFRNSNPEAWRAATESIGGELFKLLWATVIEALNGLGVKENAELLWFPQAGLGVLPLHSAFQGEGAERRWMVDSYAVRYAPSASCLIEREGDAGEGRSLFISDPLGDLGDSALELAWVTQTTPADQIQVLVGNEAKKTALLEALTHARSAHFSMHAVFQVDNPFESSFLTANREPLTLDELLPVLAKSGVREVVLSGCETALSQVARRPDEFLGFPAAFLENGARTVVATQWPVDDWAAAALIGRFYREWRNEPKKSAAQAMRAAQRWMREVTAAELLELLKPLKGEEGKTGVRAAEVRTSLRRFEGKERPFEHPYFWAAFTVSGF